MSFKTMRAAIVAYVTNEDQKSAEKTLAQSGSFLFSPSLLQKNNKTK